MLAAPTIAWNEPGDFRRVLSGASVEDAKTKVPTLTLRTQPIGSGDRPVENEILEWRGARMSIELRRFHRGTEQEAGTVRTRAGLEEAGRRRLGNTKSH